jgi:hypothetical protein
LRAGLLGGLPEIPPDSDNYNDKTDVYVQLAILWFMIEGNEE